MAVPAPLFDRIAPAYQEQYTSFFEKTTQTNIANHVGNLGALVDLAEKVNF